MPATPDCPHPQQFFLSWTRGSDIRTVRLPGGAVKLCAAVSALAVAWGLGSALYLTFHDDLVAQLIAREAQAQYAYEDRIASLKGQVERESSERLVGRTTMDGRLKELAARAGALEARASLLIGLGTHGVAAGARATESAGLVAAPAGVSAAGAAAAGQPVKPHLETDGNAADLSGSATGDAAPLRQRVSGLEERLERIDAAQIKRIASLEVAVHAEAEAVRTALTDVGLGSLRILHGAGGEGAEGGPFVPLDPAVINSTFGRALDAMQADLATVGAFRKALPHLPFAVPLTGPLEITSPFGARMDPFLGRPAMHTGVDLRDGYGTDVRATASGRVTIAGTLGGYGTMVEIDHGHGLATRYAHLSSVNVSVGEVIEKGAVVGEVGASGRATGPHLHYETRIDGEPVDPVRFLQAGSRLAKADIAS